MLPCVSVCVLYDKVVLVCFLLLAGTKAFNGYFEQAKRLVVTCGQIFFET